MILQLPAVNCFQQYKKSCPHHNPSRNVALPELGNILVSEMITPNNIRRADPSVSSIDHKNISDRDSGAFMAVVNVMGDL